jgi:hypothetical protein
MAAPLAHICKRRRTGSTAMTDPSALPWMRFPSGTSSWRSSFSSSLRWRQPRPFIPSNMLMHMERQTTPRYPLHIVITEAVALKLLRLQQAPLRKKRHRPNHRVPSQSEPLIHQPQNAVRNTPRPEIAIESPERRVEMRAAKVVG